MSNEKLYGIKAVYPSRIENANLDIVFIHGLNGDAVDSWTNNEEEFWPSWLGEDFDDVCVWSVGYDATPSKWIDNAMPMQDTALNILDQLHLKLKDISPRPIIFVTHSMGGLITKYIFRKASTTLKYKSIFENTHGIIFLAVPHDGAGGATLLSQLNLFFRLNKNVKQLSKDDPALRDLNNDFRELVPDNNLKCLCFFEQNPVSFPNEVNIFGLNILSLCPVKLLGIPIPLSPCLRSPKLDTIVSESSASGNFTRDPAIGILEDHMSICKLDSKDSHIYASIIDMIKSVGAPDDSSSTPQKTQTSKLPTTSNPLFGREDELKLLDDAWADESKYMVNLVAMGGMGKSALMNHWVDIMAKDDYRGAVYVYTWSFYSQGSAEDRQVSADTFFNDALVWFGYDGEKLSRVSQKVDALVPLIKSKKTLLILDGLEPLQNPLNGAMGGSMRDGNLLRLIKELSMGMDGLVLLSSRQEIVELKGKSDTHITQHPLGTLSSEAGIELFRHYDIIGTDKELTDIVQTYQGHALSLNLLARYLCDYEDRDIKKQDQLAKLTQFPEETPETRHAFRVMQGYEKKLEGTADLKILYMLGLFDRPTSKGAVDVLRDAKIEHLFDDALDNRVWKAVLERLRKQGLLNQPNLEYPDTLDTHPLIRQYFSTLFETHNLEAWRESHKVLYNYYKNLPKKEKPDTLEEMEPLFTAVMHGCASGLHQEVLDDVYNKRITRGGETNYLISQLGATASDLSLLANFFDHTSRVPWLMPVRTLSNNAKNVLLSWVGYRLRALGRLQEASQPMHVALQLSIEEKDWESAADDMNNISELQSLRGLLYPALEGEKGALEAGLKAVGYIDKTDGSSYSKLFKQILDRTTLADIYHQTAQMSETKKIFEEAEHRQKEFQPSYQKLYSLQGFRYCDFLLFKGKHPEVWERATETLSWAEDNQLSLLTIALDKLSLGRAKMQEGLDLLVDCIDPTGSTYIHIGSMQSNTKIWQESKKWLDEAVEGIREGEMEDYLSRALLARTMHSRFVSSISEATKDLQEVYDICTRAGMQLFLCDCHLESARLACTIDDDVLGFSAKEHYDKAKEIVEATGYKRREPELEYLEAMI